MTSPPHRHAFFLPSTLSLAMAASSMLFACADKPSIDISQAAGFCHFGEAANFMNALDDTQLADFLTNFQTPDGATFSAEFAAALTEVHAAGALTADSLLGAIFEISDPAATELPPDFAVLTAFAETFEPMCTSACIDNGLLDLGAGVYTVSSKDDITARIIQLGAGDPPVLLEGDVEHAGEHTPGGKIVWTWEDPDGTVTATACRDGAGKLLMEEEFCFEGSCFAMRYDAFPIAAIPGESPADGLKLRSEIAIPDELGDREGKNMAVNVRVHEVGQRKIAFVVTYNDGLRTVDVTNPDQPRLLGHVATEAEFEIFNDVKVYDVGAETFAAIASSERGLMIYDVTVPAYPRLVASAPDPADFVPPFPEAEPSYNVHTLALERRANGAVWAYLGSVTGAGLEIYDVSQPTAPVKIGEYKDENLPPIDLFFSEYAHDLYVENGVAYLAYWGLGLIVVDANDPQNMRKLGEYSDYMWYDGADRRSAHSVWVTRANGRKVALLGDEGAGAHMRVIDVDPASMSFMQEIGSFATRPDPAVSIHNIMAVGETAYIAYYQDGIRMVDLSDATAPKAGGHFNTWFDEAGNPGPGEQFFEGAVGLDIDLASKLIYVADSHRGLVILEQVSRDTRRGELERPECPAGTYQGICTEVNGIDVYAFCWGKGPAQSYFECGDCQISGQMPNQDLTCSN